MLSENRKIWWWAIVVLVWPMLACGLARQTPLPAPSLEQLAFEIQTATPTIAPLLPLVEVSTYTPGPDLTMTPTVTATLETTATTPAESPVPTLTSAPELAVAAQVPPVEVPAPAPAAPTGVPVSGGPGILKRGLLSGLIPMGTAAPALVWLLAGRPSPPVISMALLVLIELCGRVTSTAVRAPRRSLLPMSVFKPVSSNQRRLRQGIVTQLKLT